MRLSSGVRKVGRTPFSRLIKERAAPLRRASSGVGNFAAAVSPAYTYAMRLPVGIDNFEAGWNLLDGPGWWEGAVCHWRPASLARSDPGFLSF